MSLINSKLLKIITSFLFHLIKKYNNKILSSNSNDIYIIFLKYIQSKYNISRDKIEKVYTDMFIDILANFNYYDPFNVLLQDFIFTCIRNCNGNIDKKHIYNTIKKTIFLLLPIDSMIGGEKSHNFEYSCNTHEKEKFVTFTSIPGETVNIPYLNAKDFCMHKIYNDTHESNDKEVKINISKKKWEKDFFNTFQKKEKS
jgi:hypothetical protein